MAVTPAVTDGWMCIAVLYNGVECSIFTNGAVSAVGSIDVATDNGLELAFGAASYGGERSLDGQYDEIRLRGGSLTADRIKVDYDMIAHPGFLNYGSVTNGAGTKSN